jgi:protein-tyrosine phosphatase
VIDLHCHILPGLDDGVRTIAEARDMAWHEVGEGVTTIVATPHVRNDYPLTAEQIEHAVAALRTDFTSEGIGVDVVSGAEVDVSFLWQIPSTELPRFTLANSDRFLLVEFPYSGWPPALDLALSFLHGRGIRPVLAHPERNPEVQDRPDRLIAAVERGALVQVTAASVDGRLGPAPRLAVEKLLSLGLVHVLATDAHAAHVRGAEISAAITAIGDPALARWLTVDVPAAILKGGSIPPRP